MENIDSKTLIITIIVAVFASGFLSTLLLILNEWIKYYKEKKDKLFNNKSSNYKKLIENLNFIYSNSFLDEKEIKKRKDSFLKAYRLIFLESDDEIVKKINEAMSIFNLDDKDSEDMKNKKKKISDAMIALRKQIIKKTELTEKDFLHIN